MIGWWVIRDVIQAVRASARQPDGMLSDRAAYGLGGLAVVFIVLAFVVAGWPR